MSQTDKQLDALARWVKALASEFAVYAREVFALVRRAPSCQEFNNFVAEPKNVTILDLACGQL